jgi:hypothetical protein
VCRFFPYEVVKSRHDGEGDREGVLMRRSDGKRSRRPSSR